ncbi:MAG: ribbon-helix-helix protein, CopG family [Burkholderiaceae bacterium]|nr:ribbon-helix-helix protein, CopG family [Burkholderiaceae bacterium]
MQRSMFLKLRVSLDEAERFNARAAALGVSVSQLIRDTALHGAVFVTIDRAQAGYEFRRLGAMLKHLYPARDIRWTTEDRKKWWAMINELRERADMLESIASGGKDKAVGMIHAG